MMFEQNINQKSGLKNIDTTRIFLIEETNQNESMSNKSKKVCTSLNYIEQFLILDSKITECVSISSFSISIGIPIRITSPVTWLNICAIIAGIKKYLETLNLNKIEVLISKALIDSDISHDDFALINNVRREYNDLKEEIRNWETYSV